MKPLCNRNSQCKNDGPRCIFNCFMRLKYSPQMLENHFHGTTARSSNGKMQVVIPYSCIPQPFRDQYPIPSPNLSIPLYEVLLVDRLLISALACSVPDATASVAFSLASTAFSLTFSAAFLT